MKTRVQASRHAKTNPLSAQKQEPTLQVNNRAPSGQAQHPVQEQQTDPYFEIKMHENEQNQDAIICDICLLDDDFEGDEIVICDLCSGATHQTCYGGEIKDRLPLVDQPWYCARC